MPVPAVRFKSWVVELTDGTKASKDNLPRGTGFSTVIQQISMELANRQHDIAKAELMTNHGQARVHTGDEMRHLIVSHAPRQLMPVTVSTSTTPLERPAAAMA